MQEYGVAPTLTWYEIPYHGQQMAPDVDKQQQNKILRKGNSELISFMTDVDSDHPIQESPMGQSEPQTIRAGREKARQRRRQATAVLSKRQIEQLESDGKINSIFETFQDEHSGWSCAKLQIPGLIPGRLYDINVLVGAHLKPPAKYRGLGVRLPPASVPEPGYSRIYLPKGLRLPAIYDRCSLVAKSLATARQDELDKVNLNAVDIFVVDRSVIWPNRLTSDRSSLMSPPSAPNCPHRVKLELRRGTTAIDYRIGVKPSLFDNLVEQVKVKRYE